MVLTTTLSWGAETEWRKMNWCHKKVTKGKNKRKNKTSEINPKLQTPKLPKWCKRHKSWLSHLQHLAKTVLKRKSVELHAENPEELQRANTHILLSTNNKYPEHKESIQECLFYVCTWYVWFINISDEFCAFAAHAQLLKNVSSLQMLLLSALHVCDSRGSNEFFQPALCKVT